MDNITILYDGAVNVINGNLIQNLNHDIFRGYLFDINIKIHFTIIEVIKSNMKNLENQNSNVYRNFNVKISDDTVVDDIKHVTNTFVFT